MAWVSVEIDPDDVIDEITTEELQEELARRNVLPGPNAYQAIRGWVDAAPEPLAAEMRAWLFQNQPPRKIEPWKWDGLKSPLRPGRPLSDAHSHSLKPTISPFAGGRA